MIIGQGDTYDKTLLGVRSAIAFHLETIGAGTLAFSEGGPILEAFVAEAAVLD